ncbi:hypothetical protein FA15DRAFT_386979 [Coprinopsis marcescibilis]|uniref:Uncharacterized protein n=1 Tax=Coprinopsis marcescibilis TaxID=230819 RepID=A0A5C3KYE5_COPMA|nr:hypothetical protein FA15DRAFT_386979 [Coprinopsis marcescibilis]
MAEETLLCGKGVPVGDTIDGLTELDRPRGLGVGVPTDDAMDARGFVGLAGGPMEPAPALVPDTLVAVVFTRELRLRALGGRVAEADEGGRSAEDLRSNCFTADALSARSDAEDGGRAVGVAVKIEESLRSASQIFRMQIEEKNVPIPILVAWSPMRY